MHSAITLILNGLSKNYLKPKRTTRFSRWWHLLPLFQLILFNLFVISNFKRITWQRVPENPGLHSHWYPLMRSVHFPPCMQGSLLHSSTFVSHSVPVYPGWQTQMNELIRSWVTIIMHVIGEINIYNVFPWAIPCKISAHLMLSFYSLLYRLAVIVVLCIKGIR